MPAHRRTGKRTVRTLLAAVTTLAVVGALMLFGRTGYPVTRPHLLSGSAWLVSAKVGQLTLLDGSSAELAGQVTVASPGSRLDVVQQGATAYAVNRTEGSIRRVDGATFKVSPQVVPLPGAGDGLRAFAGARVAYALDTNRGVLNTIDPGTLAARGGPVSLTAQLVPRAAAIDDAGRLWLLDTATGDLIWVADGQRHDRRAVARPGAGTLVLAGGAPVLVDAATRTASVIDPSSGTARHTVELDLRPDDRIEVSGSTNAARLYLVAVAARGVLEVCDLTGSACPTVVPLGGRGADLGTPVESGRRIFVPDYATGQVWIVDLDQSRVVAQPKVLDPHTRFQLLNRDGVVFFNDPDSEHAGVIRLDGGVTRIAKYQPGNPKRGATGDSPRKPAPPSTGPKKPPTKQPPTPSPSTPTGPAPVIRIVASTNQPHVNEDINFAVAVDTGPTPTAVHWDFGDGTAADGAPVGHRFGTEGGFLVSARASFPGGRSAVASQTYQVTIRPPVIATLTVTGVGGGASVVSQPAGISCPPTCHADFGVNASVQLTASVDAFTQDFRGWGGPCASAGTATTCTLTLPGAGATVPANIFPQPVLTLTATGNGNVDDVNEFSCQQNTCQSIVVNGSQITLNAHPDPGSAFAGWGGACAGAALACTLTMNANRTVTATFKLSGPLPAPVQLSPADGAQVPRNARLEKVTQPVTWQAVAGADHYELESEEVSFITGRPIEHTVTTHTGTSGSVVVDCTFPTEGPFEHWRVIAVAPDGTRGTPSPWRRLSC